MLKLFFGFDREEMNEVILGVHDSRDFGALSFERERLARVVQLIVDVILIIVQGEVIAVGDIAVPRQGFVFPFHNPGESLRCAALDARLVVPALLLV